jgi:hypothetical protein
MIIVLCIGLNSFAQPPNDIDSILSGTSAYCEKLKKEVFHFFCYEKVIETHDRMVSFPSKQQAVRNIANRGKGKSQHKGVMVDSSKRRWKNEYVYEYQLIKTGNAGKERRKLIKFNGKKIHKGKKPPQSVFASFKSAIAPIYIFSHENIIKYNFKMIKQEKLWGKLAYVIEIRRKDKTSVGEEGHHLATAWIEKNDYSIMKLRIQPKGVEGYEGFLRSDKHDLSKIEIKDTHNYKIKNKGLRFPSQTHILMNYYQESKSKYNTSKRIPYGVKIFNRLNTYFIYKKYLFFNVQVDDPEFKDMH